MKKLKLPEMLALNAYWVGLSFKWNALHPIILPAVLLNFVPDAWVFAVSAKELRSLIRWQLNGSLKERFDLIRFTIHRRSILALIQVELVGPL